MASIGRKMKRANERANPMPQEAVDTGLNSNLQEMLDPENVQKIPPEKLRQMETVNAALTDMVFDPKSKAQVQKMLKDGPIELTLPRATNVIFQKFEDTMSEKNGDMPLDLRLSAGTHLFNEMAELGKAMGVIDPEVSDEELQALMTDTMQQYIERGLKEKTIDPIELQMQIEPLLSDEQRAQGMQVSEQAGIPAEPSNVQVNNSIMEKRMQPLQMQNASLKKKATGALQGVQQGGM